MHTLISTDLSEMAAQRRAVVFAVSRQVPGADPELATSCGLEQLYREIAVHGSVDRPVDYWHHAAIDAATEASATERPESGVTAVVPRRAPRQAGHRPDAPAGAELPPSIEPAAGRTADPSHRARRQLRRTWHQPVAEPTSATTAAPRPAVPDPPACRLTRGSMHDYIRHRLLPGRRRELENHLVDCALCTRAFTDVRESYWIQQAGAPVLRLGTVSLPGAGHGERTAAP